MTGTRYARLPLVDRVALRDGNRCRWCHLTFRPRGLRLRTLDHIVPRSLGGTAHPDNLCLAHLYCNSSRGNDDFATFRAAVAKNPRRFGVKGELFDALKQAVT